MRNQAFPIRLALVAVGFAISGGMAAAEETAEIVVEAAHVEHSAERTKDNAPIDTISVRHRVSYKDIDVRTSAGMQALEQRVRQSANAACKEIDVLYPHRVAPVMGNVPCEKTAFDNAMSQVRAAIAAAPKETHK